MASMMNVTMPLEEGLMHAAPNTQPSPEPTPAEAGRFTVIGSGVIGLMTASELAQQGHDVTVVSKEGQPGLGSDSTSINAVGQFLPWLPEGHADKVMGGFSDELDAVVEHSRGFYSELAKNPEQTGVMPLRNVELINDELPWPAGLAEAMRAELSPLEHPVTITGPDGKDSILTDQYIFDTFSINPRKAVVFLAEKAKTEGVKFVVGKVSPEELAQLEGVVVNATGVGAQELTGDTEVQHYKGHTIILRPKEGHELPKKAISVDDLIIMPRENGTMVVGALYKENPERQVPEDEEAKELFDRVGDLASKTADIVDGLDPELFEHSDILQHSAGYRVVRSSGGIRVEADEKLQHVLHAYGFSGIGWSVGPVFAKRIAGQAIDMHTKKGETK
jgi:glycine/D-amino acid oxidase-like deaminating enzyme